MNFAYVEPDIVPKTELSGASTERVDTRVLQAVYSVTRGNLPIYVGQQVEVFIATPSEQPRRGHPPARRPTGLSAIERRPRLPG